MRQPREHQFHPMAVVVAAAVVAAVAVVVVHSSHWCDSTRPCLPGS